MRDTVGSQNPWGLPFTRAEYLEAQLQVRSRQEAEAVTAGLFDPDPDRIGVTLADGDLLLVALVSDELAKRVIAYRPRLRDLVERFRANRDAVLASWREEFGGGH